MDFDTSFEPRHGEACQVSALVRRVTARNPGPFTFHGTNSYVVGDRSVVIIDPGPADADHVAALLAAVGRAPVAAILVTHTHRDHVDAVDALKRATGAPVIGAGPHRTARPLHLGEINPLDAAADLDYRPDRVLDDGAVETYDGFRLTAIATPGHTANHLSFAFESDAGESALFSGDHVMAWSTSIVAPPDGAMADYMASLDRLLERPTERVYWPGHGGPVIKVPEFLRGLRLHRLGRERSIVELVGRGVATIPELVAMMYQSTDKRLHGAAALSVLAHVEDLVARHELACAGAPALDQRYWRP